MKRILCALLAIGLLALCGSALAEGTRLKEAVMVYEDYDGQRAEQTISDAATLKELEDMLLRAAQNPAQLEGNTMNSTLLCIAQNGEIYDFSVATDGTAFITYMDTNQTYLLTEADRARLWEIFDLVQEAMGYDASFLFDF